MGLYGGGGTTVNYQAPVIPKDDTFANFLKYQQEKEDRAQQRVDAEKLEQKTAADARKASAAASYSGMKRGIEAQLRQGLISYGDAASQLRDYSAKYDLAPPEEDVTNLTNIYTQELLPGRRATSISAAYEEMLGRQATEEEKTKATERFNQGHYSTVQDLRDALAKSTEYQDKFNPSYLDNYLDTMYGKQATDAAGKKTGQRTVKFNKTLLPSYTEATKNRAGVVIPDLADAFTGTPIEIEEQQQAVRDARKYLYSSGLTNLQGEIDKETQKLKNEGSREVARISKEGDIYQSLVGAFNFS